MVYVVKLSPVQRATVSRFHRAGDKFFYKVMTKGTVGDLAKVPHAYQLEFPLQFIEDHGYEFTGAATFETPDSGTKWPLRISVRCFESADKKRLLARVFASGSGGWKKFVLNNNVKVGDLVVFTLIGFSQFKVFIFMNTIHEITTRVDECPTCRQLPPCPQFVTRVQPSLALRSQEVPASFWQRHRQMLRGEVIRVRGPNKVVMNVKKRTSTRGRHGPQVRLQSGWREFCMANKLQLGDNLLFSLTGPSRLNVEVLDR